jgi:hypothetical protein
MMCEAPAVRVARHIVRLEVHGIMDRSTQHDAAALVLSTCETVLVFLLMLNFSASTAHTAAVLYQYCCCKRSCSQHSALHRPILLIMLRQLLYPHW